MSNPPQSGRSLPFYEVQRFREPWLVGLVIAVAIGADALLAAGLYQQLVRGQPWGNNPVSDTQLIAIAAGVSVITSCVVLGLMLMKLETRLTPEGIQVRLTFLVNRTIPYAEIAEYAPRTYRPIREFGGWGKRWSMRGDVAYNAHGCEGVQLVLRSGQRVLIGSQRAAELAQALRACCPS